MSENHFQGFTPQSLKFLKTIKSKNDKEWFEEHKNQYNHLLLEPFRDLVRDLGPSMLSIDMQFEITPSINKTISRIYRDVRFSRDQSLFRDAMWITFKTKKENWQDYPGFFFELTPKTYRYGMGYYSASSATMKLFRKRIDEKPEEFSTLLTLYSKQTVYNVEGEMYKRIFDLSKPDDVQDFYQRKNLYHQIDDTLFCSHLVEEILECYNLMTPFYIYLRKLV